jgi:hypothetical protein
MNYKKLIAVLICLGSIASTQAMGGHILRGVKMLSGAVPLAGAILISDLSKEDYKEFMKAEDSMIDNRNKESIMHIDVDGEKVPVFAEFKVNISGSSMRTSNKSAIFLSEILLRGNHSEVNPSLNGMVYCEKSKGDALEGYNITRQKALFEFVLAHEASHIKHNDSDKIVVTKSECAPFIPALGYTGLRLCKNGVVKSLGGAVLLSALSLIAYKTYFAYIVEKRSDIEGASTVPRALVASEFFQVQADAYAKGKSVRSAALHYSNLLKSHELEVLNKEDYVLRLLKDRFDLIEKNDDDYNPQNIKEAIVDPLKERLFKKAKTSHFVHALLTEHPHPRVRAQYLREHAEKLRKEGK